MCRLIAVCLLGLPLTAAAQAPIETQAKAWHRLVGVVQYLQTDYPAAVESGSAAELEEQASFAHEAVGAAAELGSPGAAFLPRLLRLQREVESKKAGAEVATECAGLVEDLVQAGGLARSPSRPPNLTHGAALYQALCSACHGSAGNGLTEISATMNPPPASFLDPARMNGLTPYKAFNVLSFGVTGTAMPSFSMVEEKDRWDLAFFIFTLRQPPCDHAPSVLSLETLATSNDADLANRSNAGEVSCLRRRLPDADEERSLIVARNGVGEALAAAVLGDRITAHQALLDSYLNGIEPVEPLLRARDSALVSELEASFARARLAAERGSPHLQDEGRELVALIDRARRTRTIGQDEFSVFWLSFVILLRESFEAAVVIAALLAVLKKMQQPQSARIVHAGWMSAVVIAGVVFFAFRHVINGRNREQVEGYFSLFAVLMLVYAALWLNARANIRKFMGEIRERMQGAVGRGSAIALFTIAFTSMLRESLETAVFLEGLTIDSARGVAAGVACGLVALIALILFIRRVGYRLPMKALFHASTVLLLATAVVLLGKGIHSLQEIGTLPALPFSFVHVDGLGVYPDGVCLVAQALLAAAPGIWLLVKRENRSYASTSRPSIRSQV